MMKNVTNRWRSTPAAARNPNSDPNDDQQASVSFGAADTCPTTDARPRHTNLVGRSEAGFTLVELLVVMPFLLIVTALVMVTLTTAYGAGSVVQSTSQSSSQVTLAFMTLDSEIRYASDINEPGQDSANPPDFYVEFQSDWNSLCTQLEFTSTGYLQQRKWPDNATVPTGGWNVLASGLQTTPLSTNPFSLSTPQGSQWQLSVKFSAVSGTGSTKGTAQSAFTITSLDTTQNSISQGVCGGTP